MQYCRIITFLLLIHYFTPWFWPLTFGLWPLTLNIRSVSSVTWWNSVPNLNGIEQSAAELLRFQCLTLWPWTCFKCCARLWDYFHQVRPSTTYPCLNYSVIWCWYFTSSCDFDLWPVDLESSWYIKCHVIRVCTKFERKRAICGWIIDNYFFRIFAHVMSRRHLDLWFLDLELLQHFGCHAFKFCRKFERNRIIRGWVMGDLARFQCNFRGWGTTDRRLSGVRGLNFTKLGRDIGQSFLHKKFVSSLSLRFQAGRLKVEWC